MNGSISPTTMGKLLQLRMENQGGSKFTMPDTWQTTIAKEKKRTLDE